MDRAELDGQGNVSPSSEASWGRRALQVVALALWFGIPAGLLIGFVDASSWLHPLGALPTLFAVGIASAVRWALVGAVVWFLWLRLVRNRLGPSWSGPLGLALCLGPPGLIGLLLFNYHCLPGKLHPLSLAVNAGLALSAPVFVLSVGRALARWSARAPGLGTYVSILCLAGVWGWAQTKSSDREEGVDIIVLLVDVLGADSLGCYGYERPTSPNIDALAADSILFEHAIASSTFTKTSVASLFSGRFPHNHGVYKGQFSGPGAAITSDVLEEEIPTLAESFSENGWTTAGWVSNEQVMNYMGFGQGFDLYDDFAGKIPSIRKKFRGWSDKVLGRMQSFCYLHFIDLHAPYVPLEEHYGSFGHTESNLPHMDLHEWEKTKTRINNGRQPFGSQELEAYRARHDEVLVGVDQGIGRILDDLKASGRYDNSLIVLISDHGDAFWEHGFIEHSNKPYDEVIRVPLIIKLPNSEQAGRRVDQMVGLVDLGPTLLDFAGLRPPRGVDGRSFLDLLLDRGTPPPARTIFSEYKELVAIRTDKWKYLLGPFQAPELYDLETDPSEQVNVLGTFPGVAERMSLATKAAAMKRDARGGNENVALDERTIEALKELGYL